jgi:hypothetical protein
LVAEHRHPERTVASPQEIAKHAAEVRALLRSEHT